jgi:multidrug efflux pump subunit AcrA (membrane-fusion protein)
MRAGKTITTASFGQAEPRFRRRLTRLLVVLVARFTPIDDEGVVSPKLVKLGPRIDGYRVIREGLTGDETIVIAGLMRVRPGVTVSPELVELPPAAAQQGN